MLPNVVYMCNVLPEATKPLNLLAGPAGVTPIPAVAAVVAAQRRVHVRGGVVGPSDGWTEGVTRVPHVGPVTTRV